MPLTSEGNFLAYKGVSDGFRDFHTGKFDNSVGQTLQMRRNGVCDDANVDALAVSMLEAMSMPRDTPVGAVI